MVGTAGGFKPYYKWNTFNTQRQNNLKFLPLVLNLIINGIPSILVLNMIGADIDKVLNLIINGIPSIRTGPSKSIFVIMF